ncbi:efflux RND transporter periplasmic adaptor subunit [Thalassotalea aquiviva]|uniref:efflux RND transporter periplasmic adaptor subunit n=1 Tax=Thalassotalea aquiviva TaxID=3242415 RepID=UPI00352AA62C
MATKKQIIIPIVILISAVAIAAGLSSLKKPPAEKDKVDTTPLVSVTPADVDSLALKVESYGIIEPKYETDLVAQVSGQIMSISDDFVRGGFIEQGQVLAVIDPSDYEAALIDAEANLAQAQASLELEQAQGQVAKKEWQQIQHTQPTELSLRKPQLAQEKARVKAAEAAVKRARRNLERTKITAPYDAIIASREIGLGSYVSVGKMMGKILNVAVAEVRLPVADNQLQYLKNQGIGTNVSLVTTSSGIESRWQAKIVRTEGVIDESSRMNYLVAQIEDPYARDSEQQPIRYGTYVSAFIEGQYLDAAVVIPRYLVNDNKVAILDKDSKLAYREVNIYRQQGETVVINQGLEQGDEIITSALDFPVAGMALSKVDVLDEKPSEQQESQLALKGE